MIDYVCIFGMKEGCVIEYVDYLYEYFVELCVVCGVVYMLLMVFGFLIEMKFELLE